MVSRCDSVGINNNNNQPPPPAMITLDLWLPPSHVLDSWDVLDSGQLGPAARLGRVPKTFLRNPSVNGGEGGPPLRIDSVKRF